MKLWELRKMNDKKLKLLEDAVTESYLKEIRVAATGMYQIYSELINAGFDKDAALTIMLSMTTKRSTDNDSD